MDTRVCPLKAIRQHLRRIATLGNFWKHLHSSAYGAVNEQYCKMLCERLEFHRKYPQIGGNLVVAENVLRSIQNDLDGAFEVSLDMLDQMESLLLLQNKVFDMMGILSWSSLFPQGQTLLAPLILVIMDTSKLYDLLVKLVFHLHSVCPSDPLARHRDRFQAIFRQTKTFYEESSKLQYFKNLVFVSTLPAAAPNFLQASDLKYYQAPQAREIGSDPDDGRSVSGEGTSLEDSVVARAQLQQLQHSPPSLSDQRDEQITSLSRQLEDKKFAKERLIAEASHHGSRTIPSCPPIEQCENRLVPNENDHVRREADDNRDEGDRARAARDLTRAEQAEARIVETDGRTRKLSVEVEKLKKELLEQYNQNLENTRAELEAKYQESLTAEIAKCNRNFQQQVSTLKKTQWCFHCEDQAIFHCCWNTSYCSAASQQADWAAGHRRACRRPRRGTPAETDY